MAEKKFKYEVIINDKIKFKDKGILSLEFSESIFSLFPVQRMTLQFQQSNSDKENQSYNFQNIIPHKVEIKQLKVADNEFTGKYVVVNYNISTTGEPQDWNTYYITMRMIHYNQISMIIQQTKQYSFSDTSYNDIINNYFNPLDIDLQGDYLPDYYNEVDEYHNFVIPRGYPFPQVFQNIQKKLYSDNRMQPLIFTSLDNLFYITNINKLFENPIGEDFIEQSIVIYEKNKSMELQNKKYDPENDRLNLTDKMIYWNNSSNHNTNTIFNILNQNIIDYNKLVTLGSQLPFYEDIQNSDNIENLINDSLTTDNSDFTDINLHFLLDNQYLYKSFYSYNSNKNTLQNMSLTLPFDDYEMNNNLKIGRFVNMKVKGDNKELKENFKTINGKYIIRRTLHTINFINESYSGEIELIKDYPTSKGTEKYQTGGMESENSLDSSE